MSSCQTLEAAIDSGATAERRAQTREPVSGTLWMIDHAGATVLRCRCVDASRTVSYTHLTLPTIYSV